MRKGIVFSADAILALIVVMALASAVAIQFGMVSEIENVSIYLEQKAADRAVVGLYTGTLSNESIGPSAKFGSCAVAYALDPNNPLDARAQPEGDGHIFCEDS